MSDEKNKVQISKREKITEIGEVSAETATFILKLARISHDSLSEAGKDTYDFFQPLSQGVLSIREENINQESIIKQIQLSLEKNNDRELWEELQEEITFWSDPHIKQKITQWLVKKKNRQIGDILLERYKLVGFLGQGGFGATFLAHDTYCFNKSVAVKYISLERFEKSIDRKNNVRERCEREARILMEFGRDSQIPELYAFFEESEDDIYIVQEFIDGSNLSDAFGESRIEETSILELLYEICTILVKLHKRKVAHRDLKPTNLMRRKKDGQLFLVDFGAVKDFAEGNVFSRYSPCTTRYMAPEQLWKPSLSVDIYAMGIIAVNALLPEVFNDVAYDNDEKEIDRSIIDSLRVSDEFQAILYKMLANAEERYKNAMELLPDLEKLVGCEAEP